MDSQSQFDSIFLSYEKILKRFKKEGIRTKGNKEVTHKDLRRAIQLMNKNHSICRWQSPKIDSRKYFILIEGYYWLCYVCFQNNKKFIDADIDFFEKRSKQYEELLLLESKNLFEHDITYSQLEIFFNRNIHTINKVINALQRKYNKSFKIEKNNELYITGEGIEILCKEHFKQKYLQILEKYKMELTEKYIEAGYPYDNFFGKN